MKKYAKTVIIVGLSVIALASCGKLSSTPSAAPGGQTFWPLSQSVAYSNGVGVDSSGNIYVAGQTTANLASCNGGSTACSSAAQGAADYYVSKYTSTGAWVWTRQLGETGAVTNVNGLVVDSASNVYVTGDTTGDLASCNGVSTACKDSNYGGYFVSKYSSNGDWVWTRQLQSAGVNAMAIDGSNNVYVFGSTGIDLVSCNGVSSSCSGTSQGTSDYFISKYTSAGNWVWTKQMGESSQDTDGYGGTVDSAGNAYIIGDTTGNLVSCNGVSGSCSGNSQGPQDYYVSKYASDGTWQWTKQLGETNESTGGLSVAVDSSSNVYVTGRSMGNLASCNGTSSSCSGAAQGRWDYFISKYTSAGAWSWTNQLGETNTSSLAEGAAADSSGNIYVTGYTNADLASCNGVSASCSGSSQGVMDYYVSKYAPNGNWLSTFQLGETNLMAAGSRLFIDSAFNIYVTGITTANLVSCKGVSASCTGTSHGQQDYFVSKYNSAGDWLLTSQL